MFNKHLHTKNMKITCFFMNKKIQYNTMSVYILEDFLELLPCDTMTP
jgi:hypothetical protein